MQTTLLILGIVVLISLAECAGQGCLKTYYAQPNKIHLYALGILFYAVVCSLLVLSYRYKDMGLINVLWSGVSILIIVSVGIIFFGEPITQLDIAGIFLILLGMTFILWEGEHHGVDRFLMSK
jgi:multidrug transporter EmrE-like cation transporter